MNRLLNTRIRLLDFITGLVVLANICTMICTGRIPLLSSEQSPPPVVVKDPVDIYEWHPLTEAPRDGRDLVARWEIGVCRVIYWSRGLECWCMDGDRISPECMPLEFCHIYTQAEMVYERH